VATTADQVVVDVQATLAALPDGAVVLAEDETHVNLRPGSAPPGSRTVPGST
jgi:hypothetical protein